MRLQHPDLIVEFLTPEKGRGTDDPVALPGLGVNAVALRFLNLLIDNLISVKVENFMIFLPHPVNFALHKLIISGRRRKSEKAEKDKAAAIDILKALIDKGEKAEIQKVFSSLIPTWQRKLLNILADSEDLDTLSIFK